jgi:hydrogenase nickel incorporation protein HypA/HybF
MHELSILQGVLKAALDGAGKRGAGRIEEIRATVREAGHPMEASSLQSLLEMLAKGTIAEGARMRITVIPPALRCKDCGLPVAGQGNPLFCPHCRSGKLEAIDAEEIDLECDFAE